MRRFLLAAFAVAALVCGTQLAPPAADAAGKSFTLATLDTVAVVNPDASMDVTESVVYDFDGGPFTVGIRTFERNLDQITDFTVADAAGQLPVTPPGSSISGQWEWELRGTKTDRTAAYTVTYHVDRAVTIGADIADLKWEFMGGEHPKIGRMTVEVRLPGSIPPSPASPADTDTSVLRGFAHGPSNGVVSVAESVVRATVDDVPANRFVEVRAVAPLDVFTAPRSSDETLADVLAYERADASAIADQRRRHDLAWLLAPLLSGVAVIGTGLLWFTGGRERRSNEVLGEYWREPLTERPAVALANLKRGSVDEGTTIAGTLVDLAQRGYIRITGERKEKIGRDTTIHIYEWMGKEYGPDVVEYERVLLEMVFRGGVRTTSAELDGWATANQSTAQAKLVAVTTGVKAEYDRFRFEETGNGAKRAALIALCIVVAAGSWALKAWSGNAVAYAGVVAAIASFAVGRRVLANRTQAGAEAAAKANGLKKYLKDFSQLKDAPVGHLILWERYLVFAVALGVSDELVRGLASRLPSVMNDPSFGLWYVAPYGGHRFDGFTSISSHSSSFVSASTPSSSGSGGGGGFSGGGGGGGGGGGFGAR